MGRDNQPKARQAAKLRRKAASRSGYERFLIVCEGSKTEPNYFEEIRQTHRLNTTSVQVRHSEFGTEPIQVVQCAEELFRNGDPEKEIQPRAFERVYAVFDRDDHATYHNALAKAESLNGKLRNDLGAPVIFNAVPSVPCFELWLLLHFDNIQAPIHRDDAYERLRYHLPAYDKGSSGMFSVTQPRLEIASARATNLCAIGNPYNNDGPYTSIHALVGLLVDIKRN